MLKDIYKGWRNKMSKNDIKARKEVVSHKSGMNVAPNNHTINGLPKNHTINGLPNNHTINGLSEHTAKNKEWEKKKDEETKKSVEGDSFWESGIEIIKECGLAPKNKVVFISPLVMAKIESLMNKYKDREWLAYLVGRGSFVYDIYFPEQRATSASVSNISLPSNIKTIGVMHSHHHMMGEFSHTDDEFINGNHDISILVTHSSITGQYRWKTPCGRYIIINCKVQVLYDHNFDEKLFLEDVEKKMDTTSDSIEYDDLEDYFDSFDDDDDDFDLGLRFRSGKSSSEAGDIRKELNFENDTVAEELARADEVVVLDE
jgi:hypothetical protein